MRTVSDLRVRPAGEHRPSRADRTQESDRGLNTATQYQSSVYVDPATGDI